MRTLLGARPPDPVRRYSRDVRDEAIEQVGTPAPRSRGRSALVHGVPFGRIGGTRLFVTPSWFLAAAVTTVLAIPIVARLTGVQSTWWAGVIAATMAILLGVSVLAHELGHCLAAHGYGIAVPEVRLYFVGGASELQHAPRSPAAEAVIAVAGPWASAVLAGVCWALATVTDHGSVAWLFAVEMAWANGIIAVFNILPALPLDGGRVLSALVWRLTGRPRPGQIAGAVGGMMLAAALLVFAAVELAQGRTGLLFAAIIAIMAFFVATGAWSEWPQRPHGSDSVIPEGSSDDDVPAAAPAGSTAPAAAAADPAGTGDGTRT